MPTAAIHDDPERRLWLLSTPESSYVLHVDDRDRLHCRHWGVRLTPEQAVSLLDDPPTEVWPFEDSSELPLDLAPAAAFRFGHAQLAVRFADGTRELELQYAGRQIHRHADGVALVLSFTDRHYSLAVDTHYRLRDGSAVIDRHLELRNTGEGNAAEPVTVVRADSATWPLPPLADYRLTQVHGRWAAETRTHRTALPFGETVMSGRRGHTGHDANPWAMIDDGSADEEHGEVFGCALAWSGSWTLTVERTTLDRAALSAGFGHAPLTWQLAPGETLTTPVCSGLRTDGGFGTAARLWHAHQLRSVLPHPEELRPVLYNSWEATEFDVSVAGQLELAKRAADLGAELFVMDDGWFGSGRSARTGDHAGLGDWRPNPARFPDGLAPLVDGVRALGLRFGLWVEPEMVSPESELYRAHPDWVLHQPNRARSEHRRQLVLNVARDDVAAWMLGWLDRLVSEHAIDFLKWDMNRPFTEVGPGDGDPLWRDYVTGLYGVLDRLRARHPELRIESCSGGGGRIDLGILARVDQVWTSDNTDARNRLAIQDGYARLYPTRAMGAWVTDSPNPLTGRRIPLDFRFRVAMGGVLGIGGDLTAWSEDELAQARELVAGYKRIRPLVQHGSRHVLRPAGDDFSAVQFVAPDGSATAVLAYRTARGFAPTERPLLLRGLDPAARYRDQDTGRLHHGAVLLNRGLQPELGTDDYASAMVHLVREP